MSSGGRLDGRYRFGDTVVDVAARELTRDGRLVAVEPQVFEVLVVLLRERHRVVAKEELLDEVWHTRAVSESALTTRIKFLRRALGDDGQTQSVIRTSHGRGFRFVAKVDEEPRTASPPSIEAPLEQDIRFCRTADGARLGYAWMGSGLPLVKVAHWLTHLEYDLESPVWRHWYRDLSRGYRVLRYDERGCGLSDHDVDTFSVDAWVSDLESVVDAAGVDRFPLLGVSQGGAVALAYAARHPERVSAVVLWGAFVKGPWQRARRPEHKREAELMMEIAAVGWGRREPLFRQFFTQRFLPEGPPEVWNAFDELQVRTTSVHNAVEFLSAFNALDVEDEITQVQAPTLVLHSRRDGLIPMEEGRRIAALVPHARFVSLDSPNHLLLESEPAWPRFLESVGDFLDSHP